MMSVLAVSLLLLASFTRDLRAEPSLPALVEVFTQTSQNYEVEADPTLSQSSAALSELLRNRSVIPEGGVLHVVGPGNNAAEWLLPAHLRPDVRIIVFFENESSRETFTQPQSVDSALRGLARHRTDIPNSSAEFFRRATNISFAVDVSADHPEIPKADFVLAMMPAGNGKQFAKHMKPGGIGWVVAPLKEFFAIQAAYGREIDWKPIPSSPLTLFLSSETQCELSLGGLAGPLGGRPVLFRRRP